MPMHDWTKVEPGIYHAFHFNWIAQITQYLNGHLPEGYYALPEQRTGIFGPDILTLQRDIEFAPRSANPSNAMTLITTEPRLRRKGIARDFYLQKQRLVTIRHTSGDDLVSVIEIVSPGNKNSQTAIDDFVYKIHSLLASKVHVSYVDPFPPGKRDPQGLHALIWENDDTQSVQMDEPLSVVACECADETTYYQEPFDVGGTVPDMPVFLRPGGHLVLPLEQLYQQAYSMMPERWRNVLEE